MSEIGISIIASSFALYRKLLVRRGVFRSILLFSPAEKFDSVLNFSASKKIKIVMEVKLT